MDQDTHWSERYSAAGDDYQIRRSPQATQRIDADNARPRCRFLGLMWSST